MDTYTPQEIALLRAFKHIVNEFTYDEYADKMKSQHQRRIDQKTWWALLLATWGYSHPEKLYDFDWEAWGDSACADEMVSEMSEEEKRLCREDPLKFFGVD